MSKKPLTPPVLGGVSPKLPLLPNWVSEYLPPSKLLMMKAQVSVCHCTQRKPHLLSVFAPCSIHLHKTILNLKTAAGSSSDEKLVTRMLALQLGCCPCRVQCKSKAPSPGIEGLIFIKTMFPLLMLGKCRSCHCSVQCSDSGIQEKNRQEFQFLVRQ